jgi:hypothetical protein
MNLLANAVQQSDRHVPLDIFPSSCEQPEPPSPGDELRSLIEATVAGVFDVDAERLRLPTRGRANVALARQVAMYIAHVGYGLSLTEVGDLFERDRTTVAHACSVVEQRRDDPRFDAAIQLLDLVIRVLNVTRHSATSEQGWYLPRSTFSTV